LLHALLLLLNALLLLLYVLLLLLLLLLLVHKAVAPKPRGGAAASYTGDPLPPLSYGFMPPDGP
jgi:hypothetical protein